MTIRRRVVVSGRVQGVFFRDSCRQRAEQEGVAGSASNLPDGRVEVLLEGEDEAVGRMVEWCRRGPGGADVDAAEVQEETPTGECGFTVT